MKRLRFPQEIKAILLSAALLGILVSLVIGVQSGAWNESSKIFCYFYAGVVTVFFIVQIIAFVLSHADYSDSVEAPKYDMIVNEEWEWRAFHEKA